MNRKSLFFAGVERVEIREEEISPPGEGQVLVKTLLSAISPGTEMLAYRGQIPESMALDETIASLSGSVRYPFKYGYSSVGRVIELGQGVDSGWLDRLVFSFHPHETCFLAGTDDLLPVPQGIEAQSAVFLPNMETAVNFVMDGRPLIGEKVGVFGLGIVGLLTTALLSQFPLGALVAFDRYSQRRDAAKALGNVHAFAPEESSAAQNFLREGDAADALDLVFELSGAPQALDQALSMAGFSGRVVIGSWYGSKRVSLDLGGRFHRSRIQIIPSQVSTIAPELSGRWNKARRMGLAWDALRRVRPERWITRRVPFTEAPSAYRQIADRPEDTIQVVLTYDYV